MEKGHLEGQLLLFLQRSAQGREKSIRPSLGSDTHLESLGPPALWTLWAFAAGMRCCMQGRHLLRAGLCSSSAFLMCMFSSPYLLSSDALVGFSLTSEGAHWMHLKIHPVSLCVCIFVPCHVFIYSSVYLSYEQVACQKCLFLRHFLTDLCW